MTSPLEEQVAHYNPDDIWIDPPAWVNPRPDENSSIQKPEVAFLGAFIEHLNPARVLEIGTASGFSSVMMVRAALRARERSGRPKAAAPLVESFDIGEFCYWNNSRRVGSVYAELAPEHLGLARFHLGKVAADAALAFPPSSFDMAFIDANHAHPHPMLDLFYILPQLKPEAWVLLHDIHLPRLFNGRYAADAGVMHLFEHYPFPKIEGPNIGAIRIPRNRLDIVDYLIDLIKKPFPIAERDGSDPRIMQGFQTLLYTKFLQASLGPRA